jgi:YtkA-like
MTAIKGICGLLVAAVVCSPATAFAQARAKADVACRPTSTTLQYDCTITLTNARTSEPLSGVTLTVGADMPSMPMMHNVRPVKATPGQSAGTYQASLLLEMHGDWAVQLNLSGPLRDRVVTTLRFDPDQVTPAVASRTPPRHKH